MFRDKTIRNRVMALLEKKVEEAQKGYEDGVVEIDRLAEIEKEKLADKFVDSIVGKFV